MAASVTAIPDSDISVMINGGGMKLKSRTAIDCIEKDKIVRRLKEYTKDLYKKYPNTSMHF
jgi:hypothetical protein